jgi:hypothetical protein
MIEAYRTASWFSGDPILAPQLFRAAPQLLDRCAERLLGDRDPGLRRHDQPLRRDQSVRHVRRVLVEHRRCREQLSDE